MSNSIKYLLGLYVEEIKKIYGSYLRRDVLCVGTSSARLHWKNLCQKRGNL